MVVTPFEPIERNRRPIGSTLTADSGTAGAELRRAVPPKLGRLYLTVMRPFMPAAAWPLTVQRYSYLPALVRLTVSVALLPGVTIGVTLPVHAFAVPPLLLEQSLKS